MVLALSTVSAYLFISKANMTFNLTLLHSERSKLHRALAVLSAIELNNQKNILMSVSNISKIEDVVTILLGFKVEEQIHYNDF